ncbi:hypothetical protein EBR03_00965 [bacterium]|nr:hypothetical protein [bacterium]NBX82069.1 hypothetical protein [bacterium]
MKLRAIIFLGLIFSISVTRAEQVPENQARRGYYLGLGPVVLARLNSSGVGYFFSGGYAFNYDRTLLKLNAEVMGRSGALLLNGGIGVAYFPSQFVVKEFNPFVGLDFGFGTARIRPDSAGIGEWTTGFILGPQIGAQFFRNSDVMLEVSGKWGTFLESGSLGTPSYSVIKISLYFL